MTGSLIGRDMPRLEDRAMLDGTVRYLDDLDPQGSEPAAHVRFVRAPVAHARIRGIDSSGAAAASGVLAIVTGSEMGIDAQQGFFSVPEEFNRPVLADGVVRYVGEPVVAVVASSRAEATDAVDRIIVDYDPLDVVVDPRRALEPDAPILFPAAGTNRVSDYTSESDPDRFGGHDLVVAGSFVNQRIAGAPLEPSAALAVPEDGGLTLWCTTQVPPGVRTVVAAALGLDLGRVRVRAAAVGGGFGVKGPVYPEFLVVAAMARHLDRPVEWIETRSENMVNMAHGRDQLQSYQLGLTRAGEFRWLRIEVIANAGAYPHIGAFLPSLTMLMATGPYRVPAVSFRAVSVATNTTPVASFRGAGRPEATTGLERIVDMASAEIGLDPADLRRRNLLTAEELPIVTETGADMDAGNYPNTLETALEAVDYRQRRREQRERRANVRAPQLGLGMSSYVAATAGEMYREYGAVELDGSGTVSARVGTSSQGQGHATTFAQIIADEMGMHPDRITVLGSDTDDASEGMGTAASRSIQIVGSALHDCAVEVAARARGLAGRLLEANADDIELTADGPAVRGVPASTVSWSELAEASQAESEPLRAETTFDQGEATYPFGTHVAVVEVDPDTGSVTLKRYVSVDDCGRMVSPRLVEGQMHGGIAQGVGQALLEHVRFTTEGTPLATNLVDYTIPGPADLPAFEGSWTETPTDRNPLGAKGVGECGTIGSVAAVQNAVIDAVSHLGVGHIDMPLDPETVWRAVRAAGDR